MGRWFKRQVMQTAMSALVVSCRGAGRKQLSCNAQIRRLDGYSPFHTFQLQL